MTKKREHMTKKWT